MRSWDWVNHKERSEVVGMKLIFIGTGCEIGIVEVEVGDIGLRLRDAGRILEVLGTEMFSVSWIEDDARLARTSPRRKTSQALYLQLTCETASWEACGVQTLASSERTRMSSSLNDPADWLTMTWLRN